MTDENTINQQVTGIINKYMPVEGWMQAFVKDLNDKGFRIVYAPESPEMIVKKKTNNQNWTD